MKDNDQNQSAGWLVPLVLGGISVGALALFDRKMTKLSPPSDDKGEESAAERDVNALGRIIHSEAGSRTLPERVVVAWVGRNLARRRGQTIHQMVCMPTCGPGWEKGRGRVRPMSSRLPARPEDLELARLVLSADQKNDPTRGATNAFMPELQDRLAAQGQAGHRLTAEQLRERWSQTLRRYGTVGKWELWGPIKKKT